jgi:hypothetical protein
LGLSSHLTFGKNRRFLVVSFLLLALTVVNYYLNFDILAPGFPHGGSLKAYMGSLFIFPVLLLTTVQVLYASGLLHLVTRSFYSERRDFLKAFLAGSVAVFLFSGFYILVPSWGPYTFLTGSFRGVATSAYVELVVWMAVIIASTALFVRRIYGFKKGEIRWSMLVLLAGSIFLLVMAFAEG